MFKWRYRKLKAIQAPPFSGNVRQVDASNDIVQLKMLRSYGAKIESLQKLIRYFEDIVCL